jgi:hypothetical protein
MREILPDGDVRDRMIEGLTRVKAMLQAPRDNVEGPALHPADRAAEIILSLGQR